MAFIKKITQPGNAITGSLNGRIQLDEGRGRFVVTDTSGVEKTVQDINGFHLFRGPGEESQRYGFAYEQDDRDVAIIAKPGKTVQDVLGI